MRNFWTRPKTIIWGVIIILTIIIILQNVEPTSFDILFWSFAEIPKLVLILLSMAVGAILTLVVGYQARRKKTTFIPE